MNQKQTINGIIEHLILQLLSDGKVHCHRDVLFYIKKHEHIYNVNISNQMICYTVKSLQNKGIINKFGKTIGIK